ncbi:MAG: hypothetical protein Q8N39_07405 [Pelolinea sp.]|nr:hypothetical protein [Pelolinea sp.]
MKRSLIVLTLSAILLTACGGAATNSTQTTRGIDGIEIAEVVFAKSLSENMEPVDATTTYDPSEQVNVSVRINGRPKEGVLSAKFMYRDTLIAETSVDLSQVNNGVIFSVGENTFAGFYLTHEDPLYISPNYRVDIFINDKPTGEYTYSVIPPANAIKTVVKRTEFAKGVTALMDPVEPTTVFAPSDNVFFIGNGDFGNLSWIQAEWIVGENELQQDCSKRLMVDNNLPTDRFYFTCSVKDGWPTGTHKVILTVDDVVVTEATFTVE